MSGVLLENIPENSDPGITDPLQSGVVAVGDCLLSSISINSSTGALTFTVAAGNAWVPNAGGLLVRVAKSQQTVTITPTLPTTNANAMIVGIEMDSTGTISTVSGGQVAGTLTLTTANDTQYTPAISGAHIRLADIGVYRVSVGVYGFSDNTSTATQNTNWLDRRTLATRVTPTLRSTGFNAVHGETAICTAAVTATLPTGVPDGAYCMFVATGGDVTVNRGGNDTISSFGGAGTTSLTVKNGTMARLRYHLGIWYVAQAQQTHGGDLSGTVNNATVLTWGGQTKAQVVAGNPPQAHKATHEPGGSDALTALTDASFAAANKDGAVGTPSLRTLGAGAQQAVAGASAASVGIARAGAFTATAGQMNYVTGAQTCTLPSAPANDSEVGVLSLTGTVTVNRGGTDTIEEYGITTKTTTSVPAGTLVVYKYLSGVWYRVRDERPEGWNTVARAYLASAFTPTLNTEVKVPLDTKSFDPGVNFDVATNHRYVCPVAGVYRVNGGVSVAGSASDVEVYVAVYKNGAIAVRGAPNSNNQNDSQGAFVGDLIQCAANDYLELFVNTPNVANALNTLGPTANFLSVERVS